VFWPKQFVLVQNDAVLTNTIKEGARRHVVCPLFIIFNLLYPKGCLGGCFSEAFNPSSLYQTRQTRHHSHDPTPYYTLTWFLSASRLYSHRNAAPKSLTQSAFATKFRSLLCWPLGQRLRSFLFESRAKIYYQ
jgi:hypothetical protein